MRFAVESWAPEYGAAVDAVDLEPVSASVDIGVECEPDEWAPHQPAIDADPIDSVVFIDGIRRVEARVWLRDAEPGGDPAPAICASYAAGAVRCNALAQVEIARVRRGLFTSASDAEPIDTRHGRFSVVPVPGGDSDQLSLALQGRMGDLEAEVAAEIAGGTISSALTARSRANGGAPSGTSRPTAGPTGRPWWPKPSRASRSASGPRFC